MGAAVLSVEDLASFADPPMIDATCRAATDYAYLGEGVGLCRVLSRYKMFVRTDDESITAHLALEGYWEIWNTSFIARHVKPGMRVLDVGANLGYFSVFMGDLVGPSGRIAAFEPNARTAELLQLSVNANGYADRVEVVRAAASDAAGEARLITPQKHFGGASIMRGKVFEGDDFEMVPTIRLDDWCRTNGFRPDFIKVDAEGAEQKIIEGLSGVIDSPGALSLMFEFDASRWPNWQQWLQGLEAKGFKLHRIEYTGLATAFSANDAGFAKGDLFEVFATRA
jgi:FkbM family methyltransferase